MFIREARVSTARAGRSRHRPHAVARTRPRCTVGTVEARSEGATARQRVRRAPAARSGAAPDGDERALHTPSALSTMRILVVDDNHDAAGASACVLEMLGAQVRRRARRPGRARRSAQPRPAGRAARHRHARAWTAIEVAREIRARSPRAPRDAGRAHRLGAGEDRAPRLREAGFDHHLVKPAARSTRLRARPAAERSPGAPIPVSPPRPMLP